MMLIFFFWCLKLLRKSLIHYCGFPNVCLENVDLQGSPAIHGVDYIEPILRLILPCLTLNAELGTWDFKASIETEIM